MRVIRGIFLFACLSLTVACGYDHFGHFTPEDSRSVLPNADIAWIRFLCGDSRIYNVYDSIVIGGYVTANDKSGNFYRSFFIDDGSGSVEVRVGMYSLHNVYMRNRYIAVKLQGMSVQLYNGTMQVGLSANENGMGVGYIDSWSVAAEYVQPSSRYETVAPEHLTIAQLLPEHCGRLVCLSGIKFIPEDEEDKDQDEETTAAWKPGNGFVELDTTWAVPVSASNPVPQAVYHRFEDYEGNTVSIYTSGYANFAGDPVPEGRVALTGILSFSASQGYILRLRDRGDVKIY